MQVVCIQAFGDLRPGDTAEVPDGAEFSEAFFAVPGDVQAIRAVNDAEAAQAAAAPPATEPPAAAPAVPPPAAVAPAAPAPADTTQAGM